MFFLHAPNRYNGQMHKEKIKYKVDDEKYEQLISNSSPSSLQLISNCWKASADTKSRANNVHREVCTCLTNIEQ